MATLSTTSTRTKPSRLRVSTGRVALAAGANGVLILVALLALFPFFLMLSGSLQTIEELYAGITIWPAVPQLQNYVTAWTEGNMTVFIPNSVLYSTMVS